MLSSVINLRLFAAAPAALSCAMSNDHRLMSRETPAAWAAARIALTPSICDCWIILTVPSALYPGVTVPLVWNHQRTTRPPASCAFLKMVLNVLRSGFGTSLANLTHATLSPLAKSHAGALPAPIPAALPSPIATALPSPAPAALPSPPGAPRGPVTGGVPSALELLADVSVAPEAPDGPAGSAELGAMSAAATSAGIAPSSAASALTPPGIDESPRCPECESALAHARAPSSNPTACRSGSRRDRAVIYSRYSSGCAA